MAVTARPEISKILLDLGIEPVDVYAVDNAEQTYLSALREGINTIEVASKDKKGDERTRILRAEVKRIREKKRKINVNKLFARKQVIPTNKIKPQALLPGSADDEKKTGGMDEKAHSILDSIIGILRMGNKQDKKEADTAKKERAAKRRKVRENLLDSTKGIAKVGKNLVGKIVSPFSNILGAIGNFLKFVLVGYLFNVIFKWFTNPENQEKIATLTRFFKDWWPALTFAALAFLTPLGTIIGGLIGFLSWALPALVGLSKNPLLVGAGIFSLGGILPQFFPGLVTDSGDSEVDKLLENQSKEETINQLKEEQENRNILEKGLEFLTGKGKQREDQIYKLETGKDRNYGGFGFSGGTSQQQMGSDNNTGAGSGFSDVKAEPNMGTFTGDGFMKEFEGTAGFQAFNQGGVVSGAGNKDTVPAMLTPGEFVMRKDAVKKYGVNTLAGMNAAANTTHSTTNNTNNRSNINTTNNSSSNNRSNINTTNNSINNNRSNINTTNSINNNINTSNNINNITKTIGAYKTGGLVQHFNEGGLVGNMVEIVKDTDNSPTPVNLLGGSNFIPAKTIGLVALEVPVSRTTEKTIVLPEKRITKEDQTPMKIGSKTVPDIMIVNRSAYRAMTTRSLGIQDLVGV